MKFLETQMFKFDEVCVFVCFDELYGEMLSDLCTIAENSSLSTIVITENSFLFRNKVLGEMTGYPQVTLSETLEFFRVMGKTGIKLVVPYGEGKIIAKPEGLPP